MSKKRSPTNRAVEPPRTDNLKLINGIGPAVEKRLNGVSIFTFTQLAALSPADIAAAVLGIRGLTAASIKAQDWIGQASKLAARSAASETKKEVEAPAVAEQIVTFTVPVELQNAEESEQAPALVAEHNPLTSVVAQPELTGTLHLRDMKITGTKSADPRRTLSHEQPFEVRLTLDLTEMTVPGDTPLNYKASIYGRSRGSGSGQVVGEVEGNIIPAETTFTIVVEGNPLPEGIYRLAATVALSLPGTKPTVKPGTLAVIDGGQVQVF